MRKRMKLALLTLAAILVLVLILSACGKGDVTGEVCPGMAIFALPFLWIRL